MTSKEIKIILMKYFRFKRQSLVASECLNEDIIAIVKDKVWECEIKVNKYDLTVNETKKSKHISYNNPVSYSIFIPSYFYIVVPFEMKEIALDWVTKTNNKYGLILITPFTNKFDDRVVIFKKASKLIDSPEIVDRYRHCLMMRVCAENISLKEKTK